MTDVYETDLIATHYLTSIDDVTEHLRAASRLGLGVRVRSYLEADDPEDETLSEHWEVELYASSPVQEEDAEPSEEAAAAG
ncbi:hypothetical protein ACQP2F_29345 [Actinoplanes sp. CA-030573]|uniref:hypothetical protein n=1 Tax=Actinoplanes sp. CA-030573 TaxID=3239898 RepID=UPI003D9203F5